VIIEEAAGIAQYSGPGGFNYLDFLMTGGAGCSNLQPMQHCPGMTDVEYRTEFSIWVMAGSPLIVATDVRNITAIMREVLFNTELLDIHWDPLVRAGGRVASANCAPNPSQCEVWARPLFNGDYYVLGYNPSTEPVTMAIDMAAVGWGGFEYSARDLWLHQDLGVFSEPITVKLDPHGVAALRVSFAGVPSAA
jgi:alpha-galactosidase